MDYWQALVLGLVQGITEFLPVSSSGHLALLAHFYRIPEPVRLSLSAALHVGTSLSLLVYFGRRLLNMVRGAFAPGLDDRRENRAYIGFIAAATLPAVLAGLLLKQRLELAFAAPAVIGVMLLVTGALLFVTRFRRADARPLTWWRVMVVGVAQAFALLPGVSRSGTTISAGLLLGLSRREAFEFSFILAVPVTVVASLIELFELDPQVVAPGPVVLGILLAFVSGLGALVLLRRAVVGRWFYLFAFYVWPAGLAAIALLR